MKTKLCLTKDEASHIAKLNDGDPLVVVRVMNEQPPEGYTYMGLTTNRVCFRDKNIFHPDLWNPLLPYQPGKLGLRETWDWDWTTDVDNTLEERFMYKADNNEHPCERWQSPATMPEPAIRSWFDMEVECKQVQSFDPGEIWDIIATDKYELDWLSSIKDHWNDLHAKPVKSGDGYVCYPYDMDFLENVDYTAWIDSDNSCYVCSHKDKPLTIHANPWVWVLTGTMGKGVVKC